MKDLDRMEQYIRELEKSEALDDYYKDFYLFLEESQDLGYDVREAFEDELGCPSNDDLDQFFEEYGFLHPFPDENALDEEEE